MTKPVVKSLFYEAKLYFVRLIKFKTAIKKLGVDSFYKSRENFSR